jgi:phage regulator Rha-like protein
MKNTALKLVVVHNGEPFTNTLEIAAGVGLGHSSVIKLVRRYKSAFEELGPYGFQIQMGERKQGGGKPIEFAELNQDQATFLMTMFRNTEIVLEFKLQLVKAFRKALSEIERLRKQQHAPAWQFVRDETKVGFKWMNETLKDRRDTLGKETKAYHYSNEARLINAVLTGKFVGLDRNNLSKIDLSLMADLQRYNSMLIAQDVPYQERKAMLTDRATLKIAKPESKNSLEFEDDDEI